MWDTLLALPPQELVYPKAIRHYARGMAHLGKNHLPEAEKEANALKALAADTSLHHLTVWGINTTADLVQIALKVLSAEIAVRNNQLDLASALLTEAVALEDGLNYNEPPDWFFSVRHHLGALQLKAKNYEAAEKTYRRDLQTWKKNGWALKGLHNALVSQKKDTEARSVLSAFQEAWRYADIRL